MLEFFVDNLSPALVILIVSAIPLFESKVAIPLGLSVQIWGGETLSPSVVFLLALVGSVLPSLIIILISRWIKNRTCGFIFDKFVEKVQKKYNKNFEKIANNNSVFRKCLMLATFVAIPLPLTGVYSGSLIAGFTNLKIWHSFLSIFAGAVVSCLIVLLLSTIIENSAFCVLLISLIIVAIFVAINLLIALKSRIKKEKR